MANWFYQAWTAGMTPLPYERAPSWHFAARSAANQAYAAAAQRGESCEACDAAYNAAWAAVEAAA